MQLTPYTLVVSSYKIKSTNLKYTNQTKTCYNISYTPSMYPSYATKLFILLCPSKLSFCHYTRSNFLFDLHNNSFIQATQKQSTITYIFQVCLIIAALFRSSTLLSPVQSTFSLRHTNQLPSHLSFSPDSISTRPHVFIEFLLQNPDNLL